jgi:hypothetical protein
MVSVLFGFIQNKLTWRKLQLFEDKDILTALRGATSHDERGSRAFDDLILQGT